MPQQGPVRDSILGPQYGLPGPERTKMPEAKMDQKNPQTVLFGERQKPKTHKPACLCWRCGRVPQAPEASVSTLAETLRNSRAPGGPPH